MSMDKHSKIGGKGCILKFKIMKLYFKNFVQDDDVDILLI